MTLLINCDLGEIPGMHVESRVMPYIDQASIACGFHAGSPVIMRHALAMAKQHGVIVGAHPGYPDLEGFGRKSMNLSADELYSLIHYQVAAFDGMALSQGLLPRYVKPHGALYNDMIRHREVRLTVMQAIAEFHRPIALFLQATPDADTHRKEAENYGIEIFFEVFADRQYDDQGLLVSRELPDAVHTRAEILNQVQQLVEHKSVVTCSGNTLPLQADTLCLHGDNPVAWDCLEEICALVRQ